MSTFMSSFVLHPSMSNASDDMTAKGVMPCSDVQTRKYVCSKTATRKLGRPLARQRWFGRLSASKDSGAKVERHQKWSPPCSALPLIRLYS